MPHEIDLDGIQCSFNLKASPVCGDCSILLRQVFKEDSDIYFVCPECRKGIEIPGLYCEDFFDERHPDYYNHHHHKLEHTNVAHRFSTTIR